MKTSVTVTSISWIPSEAIKGAHRVPFDRGLAHYDDAPPDRLDQELLEELRAADRFRFATVLTGWIEVVDGMITDHGWSGGGRIGATTLAVGDRSARFEAVAYPDLAPEPEVGDGFVRFRLTAGGRTGVPLPRRVSRPPFVQLAAPTAWTTIELTLFADGTSKARLAEASPFPRHWLYGDDGRLLSKSGTIDYRHWMRKAFGAVTPWGSRGGAVLGEVAIGDLESDLERQLSQRIMGREAMVERLREGSVLLRQGEEGDDLFLLLDGVVEVAVDGEVLAELGPGAVLGERSATAGGVRTSTVTARTRCVIARTDVGSALSTEEIWALADEHRREERAQ